MVRPTKIVYFNVETTGLKWEDEVIELSAYNDEDVFQDYMTPTVMIHPKASQINGFKVHNGKLFKNGKRIPTRSREQVMADFLFYCKKTGSGGQVILVAHNGKCLAFDKILKEVYKTNLEGQFGSIIKGFCDTMPLFRKMFPGRVQRNQSFQLVKLYKDLIENNEWTKQKPIMLSDIFHEYAIFAYDLEDHTISWKDVFLNYIDNVIIADYRETFKEIFGDIKEVQSAIYKISEYRLSLGCLMEVYKKRNGGRAALVKQLSGENPRHKHPPVTTDPYIMKIVVDKIAEYCFSVYGR